MALRTRTSKFISILYLIVFAAFIYILQEGGKKELVYTTSVLNKTLMPIWNEGFSLSYTYDLFSFKYLLTQDRLSMNASE